MVTVTVIASVCLGRGDRAHIACTSPAGRKEGCLAAACCFWFPVCWLFADPQRYDLTTANV